MRPVCVWVLGAVTGCSLYFNPDDDPHTSVDAGLASSDGAKGPVDAPPGSLPILHYRFDDTLANDGTLGHTLDGTGTSYSFVEGKHGRAVAFDTTRYTSVVLPTQI